MLIALLALSSCSTTRVVNTCPDPVFPSCETICAAAKPDSPDSMWRDLKNMVVVMLQLRARQDTADQTKFSGCTCHGVG
jgi:hypothetical protein